MALADPVGTSQPNVAPAVAPNIAAPPRKRGTLRMYLGAAPGVGKTFAMLNEGRRRKERGTDVVVGFVETHGRPRTADQVGDLEVVPRRTIDHRGATFTEMDVEAILRRRPQQVLVDEFAHTNVPGSPNEKRWQDIDELLDAGIDVVSTVNIQHLESLNDVVERITGITQRETVPDRVVRAADQIELVDMAPDALRRRMAHGNVYAADKIDAALGNYFREGNLSALRELALLWVADRVDDSLAEYRERHGITRPWETRERVVVAVSGAAAGFQLVRRAARIAQRAKGELIGVHVIDGSGLGGVDESGDDAVAGQRNLLEELGGEYRRVTSNDVASALVEVARSENATQIVLGASKRSRWHELFNGSVINRVVRMSGDIDVHVISERPEGEGGEAGDEDAVRRLPTVQPVLTPLPPRRQVAGWVIAGVGLPVLTVLFANARDAFSLTSVLLIYLVLAMVVAVVGGVLPAAAAAIGGFLLANWYFTPPFYELTIHEGENLLALVVFLVAAGMVAVLVDRAGRSRLRAARARAEAEALAALAGSLSQPGSLAEMLGQVRDTFGFRAAALLQHDVDGWTPIVVSGTDPPQDVDDADVVRDLGGGVSLALSGGQLPAEDQRVLNAFAAQVAVAAESNRLHVEAARAGELAAANDLRAALLQAVSHDLRTPLAVIKASISSLRQADIDWPPETVAEFEETIEAETDRLGALVGNLLDMSRLQADAVVVDLRPTGVEEVVLAAVASLGAGGPAVRVEIPETLPEVVADPALLERVVANLLGNAGRVSPGESPPRVTAGVVGGDADHHVDVRVVDRGPGIRPADRELVFQPFQRLVDHQDKGTGVGLGLAIARGFVESMGAELVVEDTPGGGTTMVISLPIAGAGGNVVTRVLVVDDEAGIRRALVANLKARGYDTEVAESGEQALQVAARTHPDVVVLDLGLPGMDGLEVIAGLRGWTRVPIVVLSARGGERDKVAALDAGADDYVAKPFGMDELLARLRAAVRRSAPGDEEPVVSTEHFTVDLAAKQVIRAGGEAVRLTPTEWHLLEVLARHAGKLVTQRQLLQDVWGPSYGDESNYLRVHMAHLRRKLEPDRSHPRYLITEPGMGYRFVAS